MALSQEERETIRIRAREDVAKERLQRQGVTNAYPMTPEKDWDTFKTLGHVAATTALPTVGAIGGSMAGSLAGPMGMAAGEAAGSMLGEALNQELGITDRDENQILLAGAVPPVVRGLWGAGRMGLMRLPGAAVELQAQAVDKARALPSLIKSPVIRDRNGVPYQSDDLYKRVRELDVLGQAINSRPIVIGTKHQRTAAEEIRTHNESIPNPENRDASVTKLADGVLKRPDLGLMNMEEWDRERQAYGLASKYTGTDRTNEVKKANAKLYAAMYRDMDETLAAATKDPARGEIDTTTLQYLKDAVAMHRIEKTREELANVIETQFIQKQQGSGLEYVQGKSLRTHLLKDKWLKTLPARDRQEILATADMIVSVPGLPPPSTSQFGAGRVLGRSAGAAGVAQYATGDPNVAALAGGLAAVTPHVISYALATGPGRAMLRGIMSQTQGALTPQALSILSAFAVATQAQPGTEMIQ